MANLINLIYETVDFYYEYKEKMPGNFSNFLSKNKSKLCQILTDFVIAEAKMVQKNDFATEIKTIKNQFFHETMENFSLIKKLKFFEKTKPENEKDFFSKSALILMPKQWESFFSKNKNGSDNAKNWESDLSKNERDNAGNFGQNEHNLKKEDVSETNFKTTLELKKVQNLNFIKLTYQSKNKYLFSMAFMSYFFSKTGFCQKRPSHLKFVRFDKNMSRTSKVLDVNLGGRGYRFNMTLESRISRFKINTNQQNPVSVGEVSMKMKIKVEKKTTQTLLKTAQNT